LRQAKKINGNKKTLLTDRAAMEAGTPYAKSAQTPVLPGINPAAVSFLLGVPPAKFGCRGNFRGGERRGWLCKNFSVCVHSRLSSPMCSALGGLAAQRQPRNVLFSSRKGERKELSPVF
jgi:hypothetical protein